MDTNLLREALAGRKRLIDEFSTTAIGLGTYSAKNNNNSNVSSRFTEKSATQQCKFITTHMIDKSETGFTGLLNQGATCYLNSLLQSLYMTPELRQALFQWKYDTEQHPSERMCIPLQLQKLFARLQISVKGAIPTKDLTSSFGWRDREVYQQHDVLELSQVLFDFLQRQSFGSALAEVVSVLHTGEYSDYVQCMVCQNMRGRKTPFVGLSVDIQNCTTLEQAMKTYITPEILCDGNKVTCDICNCKQDAKKGIKLTRLPYFLGIHLKRWTFNFQTLMRQKLNNRVSFPLLFNGNHYLNSDGFLDVNENNDNNEDNENALEYELYSMMIHTGGSYGGHYFAYIKDFQSGKWLQFNDSKVTEIPPETVEFWFNPPPEPEPELESESKPNTTETVTVEKTKEENIESKPETESKPKKFGGVFNVKDALEASLKYRKKKIQITEEKNSEKNWNKAQSKRPRFLNPMSAAYMLMYRLIDNNRNVIQIPNNLINEEIVDEITKEDEQYMKQKTEYDRMRSYTTLNVHYTVRGKSILVLKECTMKEVIQQIFIELELETDDAVHDITCIRLRNMKVLNNVPLEPFDDRMDEKLEDFKFHDPKHLILEVKKIGEEFTLYEKDMIQLRMIEMDSTNFMFKPEVLIQITEDATVGELRAICASQLNVLNAEFIRVSYCSQGLALLLSDDKKRIKRDERIESGHQIHVEVCSNIHTEGVSLMMQKFDIQLNTLHLAFNKFTELGLELNFDQYLDIDVRSTIGELRAKLAVLLDCLVSELVLRKNFNDLELKDDNKTLMEYGLHLSGFVYVFKGRPLKANEYLFQIFIEDEVFIKRKEELEKKKWDLYLQQEIEKERQLANKDGNEDGNDDGVKVAVVDEKNEEDLGEPFLFLGDIILQEEWTVTKVKEFIVNNVENVPNIERMRLRAMQANRMTKCYFDALTLRENLKNSIKDYTQICCQTTSTVGEELTRETLLMYVARWYPAKMITGPMIEYPFKKRMKVQTELKEVISELSGLAVENICVTHPRAYLLKPKNRRKICVLDWNMSNITLVSTLTGRPWRCKMGQFLLYKDVNEAELFNEDDWKTGSISMVREPERGIVFYSPEDQIKREDERAKREEEEVIVQSQAQIDAIQRLNANATAAANKAKEVMAKSGN